jgi:hypothetical protein
MARQPIEELWQKWRQPEIWRLPHGHISWVATLRPGKEFRADGAEFAEEDEIKWATQEDR